MLFSTLERDNKECTILGNALDLFFGYESGSFLVDSDFVLEKHLSDSLDTLRSIASSEKLECVTHVCLLWQLK